ncbi:MAG TPA: disulfide bond formation protein B [Acidimicrobiales bacterium]|nr:disulfide bond formation protein B [Acidimicrobiales bacterium]
MTTSEFSRFFAVLSLACGAGTLVIGVAWVAARVRPSSRVADLLDGVAPAALWVAWIVAAVTTFGSLYYSEVAHFVPCKLCWYQRIAVYPLSLVLLVAGLRRDDRVWTYVLPPALVGLGFAVFHTQLQAYPHTSSFCTTTEPCTARYVWEFGFVSLPFMAMTAFAGIIALVLLARRGHD